MRSWYKIAQSDQGDENPFETETYLKDLVRDVSKEIGGVQVKAPVPPVRPTGVPTRKGNPNAFLTATECDRCGNRLGSMRTTSWFTEETICNECSDKERDIKSKLRAQGIGEFTMEGCGYVPEV